MPVLAFVPEVLLVAVAAAKQVVVVLKAPKLLLVPVALLSAAEDEVRSIGRDSWSCSLSSYVTIRNVSYERRPIPIPQPSSHVVISSLTCPAMRQLLLVLLKNK